MIFCLYNTKHVWLYRSICTYNTQNRTARLRAQFDFEFASISVMNQLQAICCSPGCNGGDLHCHARLCLEHALRRFYKFTGFRPGQLEAMLPVLHCDDVFIRMATGSGKSLCMFLPPLAVSDNSMAVIISPLIGLMDQQVRKFVYPCVCISINL